jgi:hypothetical protein
MIFAYILTSLLTIVEVSSSHSHLLGETTAVYSLLKRVLKGKEHPFSLQLVPSASDFYFFRLQDDKEEKKIVITASTASELSAGVGWYLRHVCNMTIGWPQGGGSRLPIPTKWPKIGPDLIIKKRAVEWSYFMVSW